MKTIKFWFNPDALKSGRHLTSSRHYFHDANKATMKPLSTLMKKLKQNEKRRNESEWNSEESQFMSKMVIGNSESSMNPFFKIKQESENHCETVTGADLISNIYLKVSFIFAK